jgi:hypothetical protein
MDLANNIGALVPEDLLEEYLQGQKENEEPIPVPRLKKRKPIDYFPSAEGDIEAKLYRLIEPRGFAVGQRVWWEDYPKKSTEPCVPIVFGGRVVIIQKVMARVQPVRTTCDLGKMEWSAEWTEHVGQLVTVSLRRLRPLIIDGKVVD